MPDLLASYPLRILINGQDVTSIADTDGLTWSNVDPGGYETCSINIPRDSSELQVGQPIRIETGMETAWEGRIAEMQRSLGAHTAITGEGYGAILKEKMHGEVYVDRSLSRWSQPSIGRQKSLVNANNSMQSFSIGPDPANDAPSLILQIQNSWTGAWIPTVEAWYDAGPNNLIAKVWYDASFNAPAGVGAWTSRVHVSDDDVDTNDQPSGQNYPGPSSGYFNPATNRRYAFIGFANTTVTAGTQGATYTAYYKNPAVYGDHSLALRGSDPSGLWPSAIVKDALAQQSQIVVGYIPDFTSFIVPHYVQYVPVPLEQIISDMGGLAGVHWGVWESANPLLNTNPRLDFLAYPSTPTCYAFRQDCDTLDINEQLSGLYNNVWVTYTTTAGTQKSTRVSLDNPYLDAVGLSRTLTIDMGTSTAAAAQTFGTLMLKLSQMQARASGQATLSNYVSVTGGQTVPWLLKAGHDRIRIIDMPGQSAFSTPNVAGASDFIISRVETTVSSSGVQTSLELGQGANLIEVLQARLQSVSTLAGVA